MAGRVVDGMSRFLSADANATQASERREARMAASKTLLFLVFNEGPLCVQRLRHSGKVLNGS
ncbi:MAG: hypothetical protein AAFN76_08770 [Pseudomonadota bacterium]